MLPARNTCLFGKQRRAANQKRAKASQFQQFYCDSEFTNINCLANETTEQAEASENGNSDEEETYEEERDRKQAYREHQFKFESFESVSYQSTL